MLNKQNNLKEVRPSEFKMKMDLHKIRTMENQLDKSLVDYSKLQASNLELRKKIDVQRKQSRKQYTVNNGYNKEINHIKENCKKMNSVIMQRQSHSETTNNQILALKAKHEHDKLVFEMKILEL
jgi:23S rRNA pseudoU1915 N3-methylase RlmH